MSMGTGLTSGEQWACGSQLHAVQCRTGSLWGNRLRVIFIHAQTHSCTPAPWHPTGISCSPSTCVSWYLWETVAPRAAPVLPQPQWELPAANPGTLQLLPWGIISVLIKGWRGLNVIQEKYFGAKNTLTIFASFPEQTSAWQVADEFSGPMTHVSSSAWQRLTSTVRHHTKLKLPLPGLNYNHFSH